ncbi:MAG TPA: hypothetical protein VFR61_10175 [Nitrososphaeraceae archaeon]|jgi:hypothetical protein|nr:hypothetical protein [Nitrososphaeraceae archaeon]
MSSKLNQLENQQHEATELSHFKKFQNKDETYKQNKAVGTKDNFTTDIVMTEPNRTPREKINIEIDIFQRTAVFSSDFSMWI